MTYFMKKDLLSILVFFLFFLLYAFNADYGHRVNDLPYFNNAEIDINNVGTALERDSINGTQAIKLENPNKWLMRFRLYSVDADEMNNIMALARIKPKELKFDPHHYSYGGGYIYPLGFWFLILKQTGFIQVGNLEWMINNPQEMDSIYHAGRVFTLVAFFISVIFLYYSLRIIRNQKFALICSLIYLSTPSIFMFAMVMKPHAYALLWVNMSIFILTRSYFSERFTFKNAVTLGISLGLVVGSVVSYALFAILVWIGLYYFAYREKLKYINLLIVPIIAIVVYFLVNPYVILNYDAFVLEAAAQQSWFFLGSDVRYLWLFLVNSLIPGFGIGIVMLLLYIFVFFIFNPPMKGVRLIALSIFSVILIISSVSASVSDWHINSRYVLYIVPAVLVLYALYQGSSIKTLSIVLLLTLTQMFPLLLAHYDEDSLEYSTRLQAAKWINDNISNNELVCTSGRSIAPYDTPPFNFMSIKVENLNKSQCDFFISVDRQTDQVNYNLGGYLIARFEPRLNISSIPLVYSHINPQISIYKK
jgi:hypothetical protein